MSAKITVVGSLNMDLVTNVRRIPNPGETVIGGDLHTIPGGKGANQAVAAARLGSRVAMVGRVGNDLFAERMVENLRASGVDTTHITRDVQASSGVALIAVDMVGQNSIVVAPGANARLTEAEITAARDVILAADVLLLQLEIPLSTAFHAAKIAKENGVTVILNPAPAQLLPAELIALVDVIIPNESETALLTNRSTKSQGELEQAACALVGMGIPHVILTLGDRGALLAQQERMVAFPVFEPANVIDTTAAGDAFVGGFATALAEGKKIAEAVPWGNAAGSLAVTRLGAQNSLPHRVELEALLSTGTADQLVGIPIEGCT